MGVRPDYSVSADVEIPVPTEYPLHSCMECLDLQVTNAP